MSIMRLGSMTRFLLCTGGFHKGCRASFRLRMVDLVPHQSRDVMCELERAVRCRASGAARLAIDNVTPAIMKHLRVSEKDALGNMRPFPGNDRQATVMRVVGRCERETVLLNSVGND